MNSYTLAFKKVLETVKSKFEKTILCNEKHLKLFVKNLYYQVRHFHIYI